MRVITENENVVEIPDERWEAFLAFEKSEAKDWPQIGDDYWFIDHRGDAASDEWTDWNMDKNRQAIGNIYRTEAEALAQVEKLKAKARIDKYIADNGLEVAQPNELVKWAVCCDVRPEITEWEVCSFGGYVYGGLCLMFQCRDHAQQVIDNCTDDLKTIFGVK